MADSLRDALEKLVALKDGPRDDAYRSAKDAAWQSARDALAAEPVGVSDEAVEAAARALAEQFVRNASVAGSKDFNIDARAALEAAAPYMGATPCTCPTDADVTPDMRTETGQHLSGCPSVSRNPARANWPAKMHEPIGGPSWPEERALYGEYESGATEPKSE